MTGLQAGHVHLQNDLTFAAQVMQTPFLQLDSTPGKE
jgi:hypothetical protein